MSATLLDTLSKEDRGHLTGPSLPSFHLAQYAQSPMPRKEKNQLVHTKGRYSANPIERFS